MRFMKKKVVKKKKKKIVSKKLKAHRAAYKDPINYTCGECRKVHAFDPDKPYECPDGKPAV